VKYTWKQLEDRINAVEYDVIAWWTSDPKAKRKETARCRKHFSDYSVANGGGKTPYFHTTQDSSTKLTHNGHIVDVEETVHYGAPARESGIVNMCIHSTHMCRFTCLWRSGQLGMPSQQRATIIRTRYMAEHPYEWAVVWLAETETHARRIHACGKKYWARWNGTTDHRYEAHPWLMSLAREAGVDLHFDYTKRNDRTPNDLYYLAKSATERTHPDNVTPGMVVIVDVHKDAPMPDTWNGMPVIDGDHEFGDLRPLDQERPDAVILLRSKGVLRKYKGEVGSFVKPADVGNANIETRVTVRTSASVR
jgi:hypothetical protein